MQTSASKSKAVRLAPTSSLTEHPLACLVPGMRPSEWQDFYADIAFRGIITPLEVLDGTVVDGKHRLKAAKQLNLPQVPIIDASLSGDSLGAYILKAAVLRRHLTDDQRATMAQLWKEQNKKQGEQPVNMITLEHHCSKVEHDNSLAHYLVDLTPQQAEEAIRFALRFEPCPPLDGKRGTTGLEVKWGLLKGVSRRDVVVFLDELKRCDCRKGIMVSFNYQSGAKRESGLHKNIKLLQPKEFLNEATKRRAYLDVSGENLRIVLGEDTEEKAAQLFKTPRHTLDRASKVYHCAPELFERVHQGEIALNNAYRQVKGQTERAKIANTKPPTGAYQVIVIDPPWPYTSRQWDASHQIASPYESMSIEELKELKIPAAPNSVLWLWATNTFLHDAFHLLEAWGFKYRIALTWAKNFVGLGDWLGGQTEHCLLATKGNYRIFRNNESTLLEAPRTKHSQKPSKFYELVEGLCPGEKIDMFARTTRQGWTTWGAEIDE